jgi:lipoate-protein ligase A
MHHGTLLFSTDLDIMTRALAAGREKFQSHGVASIRSRVTNIADHLPESANLSEFKDILLESINQEEPLTDYGLTSYDIEQVNHLREVKYNTWSWNYGGSPWFNVRFGKRFAWGQVDIRLQVQKGLIKDCRIWGDFFALKDIEELERHFMLRPFSTDELDKAAADINIGEYITGATKQDFIELFHQ